MTSSSRRDSGIPFTSSDLRDVADKMDSALAVLDDSYFPEDDWRWGVHLDVFDDLGYTIGEIRPTGDGWFGFWPEGW